LELDLARSKPDKESEEFLLEETNVSTSLEVLEFNKFPKYCDFGAYNFGRDPDLVSTRSLDPDRRSAHGSVNHTFLPVLRIRIRDPVPF
jgi:hypothetical protein